MKDTEIINVENVISNLESLSACFLEGEDYCNVAVIEGTILEMRHLLNVNIRNSDAIRAFIDSSRGREVPLVVTNKQLHSLAHWIVTDTGLLGMAMVLEIISVLRKRLPTVLGVVIEETE